jgi:hypothetical protein
MNKRTGISLEIVLLCFALFMSCTNDGAQSKCELEPEVGLCNAAIPKYYFDEEEQRCKEFIWGGCGGVVPFDTLEECQECE